MSLGNIENIMNDQSKITNLDWLDIKPGDYDNIPSDNAVEVIPQLARAWNHMQDRALNFIPNAVLPGSPNNAVVGPDQIVDVVMTAKKAMMAGSTGKDLSMKLASLYQIDVLEGAKSELIKLADEQGLLGNVYVDLSAYDTCREAAKALGPHRVRLAKFAVGKPKRQANFMDDEGYCLDLKKKVVNAVDYSAEMLSDYTNHLRVAGVLKSNESVTSKATLREALLKKNASIPVYAEEAPKKKEKMDEGKVKEDLSSVMGKKKELEDKTASDMRLQEVKPILAFIQDEMLKGRIGSDLKESISKKYAVDVIQKYAPEIKRVASLQGLLGNVYVDVSYYDSADAAIKSIRNASTKPAYLVYNPKNAFDNTLDKVMQATGCVQLPRDGKIDKKIAMSYVEDLQFNSKISSEVASNLIGRLNQGENTLQVIKESFIKTAGYVKAPRVGGVEGVELQSSTPAFTDFSNLKTAATKALTAGVSFGSVQGRLSTMVKSSEAQGITKQALKGLSVVNASSLDDCQRTQYAFSTTAQLKKAGKCDGCSLNISSVCTKQRLSFTGFQDPEVSVVDVSLLQKSAKVKVASSKEDNFFDGEGISIELNGKKFSSEFDVGGLSGMDGVDSQLG